jgi:uncharacterized protein (TIGR00297 family)
LLDALIAVSAAAGVSLSAWRLGALSRSGAFAGTIVGATVFEFGGFGAALVLVLFFVSSSGLSLLPPAGERSARDARQVLANGLVAAGAAAVTGWIPQASVALLGAVAAATADTWATEIGVRLGKTPRSILTLRKQAPGTSGAVSFPGTLAAAAGASAVAGAGYVLIPGTTVDGTVAVAVAGLLGSIIDSVLGAAVQARYRCAECRAAPEVVRHAGCEVRAERVSGMPGLDNDAVNLLATVTGALAALVLCGAL